MTVKTRPFDATEYLDSSEAIAAYLTAAFETNDPSFIADAISLVARARGMPSIAREASEPAHAKEQSTTVFVYVNTSKEVGDRDHIKVFANQDAAETWFEENDPEGVAFEYEVLE
jgi:hypothetical protein